MSIKPAAPGLASLRIAMIEPEHRPPASVPTAPVQLLRGRNFGLITERGDSDEAGLFQRAAASLGARVALIRPSVAGLLGNNDVADTARWLGRLYDAIECQGLPGERVKRIRAGAGIPVFDDIAVSCTVAPAAGTPLQRLQAELLALFR
jgi:ornithine carbamoyltransferase